MPQRLNHGVKPHAQAITARFSNTGVAAGTAKRRQVFKMPADRATKDIKPM
jgi:hypothetical protein